MKSFHELFRVVAAVWQIGNRWLRRIAIFAIIWPVVMLVTAMELPARIAVTVIPIIALLPIVALIILALQWPLAIATAATAEIGREAISTVATILGAELVIGLYFTLVPVSNDRGLAPLFLLSVLAIAFLRVGKVQGWIINTLTLLVVVLTLIFLLGGRDKVQEAVESAFHRSAVIIDNHPSASNPNYYRNYQTHVICPDAWKHDFAPDANTDHFDITLHDGCFSGFVKLPARFIAPGHSYWWQPLNPDPNWWVAFWYEGQAAPKGPYGANGHPECDYCPIRIRLQGHGTIRYYTNDPPLPSPASRSEVSAPALAQPKPFRPDWMQAEHARLGNFTIDAAPCLLAGTNLHCFFHLTNQSDHDIRITINGARCEVRAIDDLGKEYPAAMIELGTQKSQMIQPTVPSGVPLLGSIVFQDFTGQAVTLLEFGMYDVEQTGQLRLFAPGQFAHIRNLPVERQEDR